jgi:hypothetical protein
MGVIVPQATGALWDNVAAFVSAKALFLTETTFL